MQKIFSAVLLCAVVALASCKKDTVNVVGITLNKQELVLTKGTSEVLIAYVTPENATNKDVVWRSSDETVAKVSPTGEVTALKVGGGISVIASTVDGTKTETCIVTVTPESAAVGFAKALTEVPEYSKTGTVEIPISIPEGMQGNITCTVEAIDGNASSTGENWDYKLKTTEVKIASATKEGKIVVELQDFIGTKIDRSFKLRIKKASTDCNTETVTISSTLAACEVMIKTIEINDRKAAFEKTLITADKSMGPIDFGICLTAPLDRDARVTFQPKAGATAIDGTHFRLASHELIIKAGGILATTKLEILEDVDATCEFEITETTGIADIIDTPCRLNIQKITN